MKVCQHSGPRPLVPSKHLEAINVELLLTINSLSGNPQEVSSIPQCVAQADIQVISPTTSSPSPEDSRDRTSIPCPRKTSPHF
jgi:hypothetical protein